MIRTSPSPWSACTPGDRRPSTAAGVAAGRGPGRGIAGAARCAPLRTAADYCGSGPVATGLAGSEDHSDQEPA